MSQEQLAERVNISVTHMSHIETGNTKLSLPVLVDIAAVLQVQTDDLLFENKLDSATTNLLLKTVQGCTPGQIELIAELAKAVKNKAPLE